MLGQFWIIANGLSLREGALEPSKKTLSISLGQFSARYLVKAFSLSTLALKEVCGPGAWWVVFVYPVNRGSSVVR